MSKMIPIADIEDGGAQMRVGMSEQTVVEYVDAMKDGAEFPPIVVFEDDDGRYWLGDGYHRKKARQDAGFEDVAVEVRKGSSRDAIMHGISANATHGLRRTQEDKRRAVERLLTDAEWAKWSDRNIAKAARVDHKTVAKYRRELTGGEIPTPKPKPNGGEIPTTNRMTCGPMVERVLATIPDEALVSECRRRGLEVGNA